jgi:oligogalacturonide lyase
MVTPMFTPSSQRIFFTSDRDGKPAIYTMSVEKLVESTDAP